VHVTWVIGMSGHFIGAVLIADVRVSFPSGEYDMLRKIHPVAPNIAIGFSGSVKVGFEMVELLRDYIADAGVGDCPPPGKIVHTWWRHARRHWKSVDFAEAKYGCKLIVAGAQPAKGIKHPNIAYRLCAPEFTPERIDRQPKSVGSGNGVANYRKLLGQSGQQWYEQYQQHPQFMQANAGPLTVLGDIIRGGIANTPVKSVSGHLHLCAVRCNDILWDTNDTTLKNGQLWTMPKVATDRPSYLKLVKHFGIAAEGDAAVA
jgi:hypothetical protein